MKQDQDDLSARNLENSEQADDVATLYSWANLHGAKYRDFSASRQQMRAQMRQRTLAERAREAREEAQPPPLQPLGQGLNSGSRWEDLLPGAGPAGAAPAFSQERRFEPSAEPDRIPGTLPAPAEAATRHGLAGAPFFREERADEQGPAVTQEPEIAPVRPAWLAESVPQAAPVPVSDPQQPAQPTRERVASRWYGLRGVFGRSPEEVQQERPEGQIPMMTLFSLAGGVGKTSLAAAIGRALASRGERVLLTDTCSFGVLPFYFGAREIRTGVVRTFSGGTSDPPIRVLTLDIDRENADPELLRRELLRGTHDVNRVLIDVATGSASILRQALRLSPLVLVPVVPDMTSVVTLQALEGFFRNQEGLSGKPLQAWYVLSQFDPLSPLQLDVREVLRQQLGERLLPFAVHRTAAVSEALAEGMTVIDYAPNSPATEDVLSLASWVRNTSVAAGGGHRAMRWSER